MIRRQCTGQYQVPEQVVLSTLELLYTFWVDIVNMKQYAPNNMKINISFNEITLEDGYND